MVTPLTARAQKVGSNNPDGQPGLGGYQLRRRSPIGRRRPGVALVEGILPPPGRLAGL